MRVIMIDNKILKLKPFFMLVVFVFFSCEGMIGLLKTVNSEKLYWELEVTTTDINQNMTIGLDNPENIHIIWGDGKEDTTNLTHIYSEVGVYTLRIRGHASRIHFDNADAQVRLTKILSVVQGIDGITSFNNTFKNCTKLISIPTGLFDNCPDVTDFTCVFRGCSGLTGAIPSGLFDKNILVINFVYAFGNCTQLTSIPSGLFANNTQVKNFLCTFYNCTQLTSIPSGLFDKNTQVTNFYGLFQNCSGLTGSIPTGLFDNCPLVTTFNVTFAACTGLTSIPAGLYNYNSLVTNFYRTFWNCTSITSAVPELWVDTTIKFPNLIDSDGCFNNVTSASNSGEIKPEWI